MTNNPPIETIRYGALKATIWRNEGESGPYFTTSIARTYRTDDGGYARTGELRHGLSQSLDHKEPIDADDRPARRAFQSQNRQPARRGYAPR